MAIERPNAQYEKELEVAPYNLKELKHCFVNKLYLHKVKFTISSTTLICYIINFKKDPYDKTPFFATAAVSSGIKNLTTLSFFPIYVDEITNSGTNQNLLTGIYIANNAASSVNYIRNGVSTPAFNKYNIAGTFKNNYFVGDEVTEL